MSAVGSPQEVLTPILLRSTTPAPGEKVMKYLQSMTQVGEEPDNTPPRSVIDSAEYRSNRSGLRSPPYSPRSLGNGSRALSVRDGDINGDDADSNVQEESTSEIGGAGLGREPGPHDPPGPKYESYDSGPSFGNFGPLPTDDTPASSDPYGQNSWNPNWNGFMNNPNNATPNNAAKIPLPPSEFAMSPRAPSIKIDAQSTKPRSQFGTAMSPKPSERLMSPRSTTRTNSRGLEEERPMSPMSVKSKTTARTRATEKGTVYPPLPESRYGDGETNFDVGSPKSRAYSKAPSISPSDSPSNFKPPRSAPNGTPRSPIAGSGMRPFSPFRHGPTTADLMYAAIRNRSMIIPEEEERVPSVRSKTPSVASPSQISKAPSQANGRAASQAPSQNPTQSPTKAPSKAPSRAPSEVHSRVTTKQPSVVSSHRDRGKERERTPSPEGLDPEEAQIVADALGGLTPRTSYYAEQPLSPDVTDHYHDTELCVLLHQEADEKLHDLVRKALRKAIRQRVKKLGMKYDAEEILSRSRSDPSSSKHTIECRCKYTEPPKWAVDLKREIVLMQQRLESIGENLKPQDHSYQGSRFAYEGDEYTRTPMTQTVNIQTQPTGTMADSMYQGHEDVLDDNATETQRPPQTEGTSQFQAYSLRDLGQDDSPGSLVLEEELYKLRQKPASQSGRSHHTWEVTRDEEGGEFDDEGGPPPSGLPTIPDTNGDGYADRDRSPSPPLPPLPNEDHDAEDEFAIAHQPHNGDFSEHQVPPWQKIHQRLLNWAIIWPMSEFDQALNSTTRGNQVDEVALSIWATQTYKRYVRARLTEGPSGAVDRLFVPPNVADVISNAVFNGRHGDACGMLKDLWNPFGLEGMPRLIIVLAKHRSDPNHWVVHRFSLPEGKLATYDTYQERTLPDGRPLGWWFAIRIAWPNAPYPSPESLVQKMIRLHRPMQLGIDNSVAAAGIWRNLLMGSRAERSLDLERLRDLINTEVKNLRQRKQLGKLSAGGPRPTWEDTTS
ncbi:hypothetical protein P691DRAFT_760330 [Macrolepiota fuliginosa MF-IS2]|uniref:Uncharacterized protein n=1 Tax=Macrolepiota fuliginosa MF-IS2 TaxID=1400762 RepID=A0A9P5XBG2_9AGAR|nr:hypothetical protein P691DRAFT_760330 [Macrolepiota fuliginosa MF-IS2]